MLLSTIAVFGLFEFDARRDANRMLQDKLDKLVAIQSAVVAKSLWNVADEQIKLIPCLSGYHPHPLYVVCTHFPE